MVFDTARPAPSKINRLPIFYCKEGRGKRGKCTTSFYFAALVKEIHPKRSARALAPRASFKEVATSP